MTRDHAGRRPSRGVFLAFEGIDGGGKTTQVLRLREALEARGYEVVQLKEPTTGPWGMKAREIAVKGREGLTAEEELGYYILDRRENVSQKILPALEEGRIVIIDRYFYSTIAYQSALGLDPRYIRELNAEFPEPDLVFLLEIPTEVGRSRITGGRGEQTNQGYEQSDYLNMVKAAFDAMTDPNIVRIDASREPEAVAADIREKVVQFLDAGPSGN